MQMCLRALMAIIFSLMVIIVFSNVVSRYFLNFSIAWSEEVARFMLIWLAMIGAVLAYVEDEHLGLDILVTQIPRQMARVVAVMADLLVLYAIYLITLGGIEMVGTSWNWLSPATATSYGLVYLVVPAAGAVLFLQTISKMAYHIKLLLGTGE